MPSGSGYFKTSYGDDMALWDTAFRRFWVGVFILGVLLFPFIAPPYHVHLVNLGFLMGLPALRLRALYLVLGTMAMHFILVYAGSTYQKSTEAYKWGISVRDPTLGPVTLNSNLTWYFFLVLVLAVVTLFCINLVRSRVGRAWMAIRDLDIAAQILGVNIGWDKLLALALSGALTTLAGSLSAYY